jgi:hypothetical protein
MRKYTIWSARLCIWIFAATAIVLGDESAKQRFLSEYPPAATAFKNRIDDSKGEFRFVFEKESDEMVGSFFRTGGYEKAEIRTVTKFANKLRTFEEVYCAGPDSYFHLAKRAEGSGYAVKGIKGGLVDLDIYYRSIGRYLKTPLGGFERPILHIMRDRGFELIDAQYVAGRPGIVQVQFRAQRPARIGSEFFSENYEVEFDTNNHWAVVAEKYQGDVSRPEFGHRLKIIYGPKSADGFAMPTRIEFDDAKAVCEIRNWVAATTERSDFETSFYGLPRIDTRRSPPGRGSFFWGVVIAIIALSLLGLRLYVVSNRGRISEPPLNASAS